MLAVVSVERKPSRSAFRTAFASVTRKSTHGATAGSISVSSSPSDSASIEPVQSGDPTKTPNVEPELFSFSGILLRGNSLTCAGASGTR